MTRRSFLTTLAAAVLIRRTITVGFDVAQNSDFTRSFASGKLEYGKWYPMTEAQRRSLMWLHGTQVVLYPGTPQYERWMKDRHIVATMDETHAWTSDALMKFKQQSGALE